MKHVVALLIAALLAVACGTPDTDEATQSPETTESETGTDDELEALGDVQVEQNRQTVQVTIPPDFMEGADPDTVMAEAREQGINDVTVNDDGSVTYTMSRDQHGELMDELRDDLAGGFQDLPTDFPSIQGIEHNRDFTQFTLTVDRSGWDNGLDGFATLAIAMGAGFYHIFDGTDPDDLRIVIDIVDSQTGNTFDTLVLPEDWDD